MKTETQNAGLDYEVGRTLLKPRGTNLIFIHQAYGPNTYAKVKEAIEQDNLKPATMAETASLAHAAFNSDDNHSKEIRKIMKERGLWAFTGTLYTPKLGYVQDNPETREGMPYMDESDLVKKLEAGDSSVRTFNYCFKTGEMSPGELAKNEYVQALAGDEGAEKLAELAGRHESQPYLWGFKSVSKPETRVSALFSNWNFGTWLYVYGDGYGRGNNRYGCALGVQVSPQAPPEK